MVDFQFDTTSRTLRCLFGERMDTVAAGALAPQLDEKLAACATDGPVHVVFDMGKVVFVASAFLRICLKTAKETGVTSFVVANSLPEVKKVFKIAGLETPLNVT